MYECIPLALAAPRLRVCLGKTVKKILDLLMKIRSLPAGSEVNRPGRAWEVLVDRERFEKRFDRVAALDIVRFDLDRFFHRVDDLGDLADLEQAVLAIGPGA